MLSDFARGLLALVLVGLFSLPAGAADEVLTLDEALRLALSDNPGVQNAGLDVEKIGDRVSATRARQFPTLSTIAHGSRNFDDESFTVDEGAFGTVAGTPVPPRTTELKTKEDFSAEIGLEVRQPLAQLHSIGLEVDKLRVEQQIGDQKLRSRQQQVALNVKQEYYAILSTQSALDATEQNIAFYKSLVEIVANKVKEQTALEYQLLDAEARQAKAEYDALKLRNDLADHRERLNALMGRDVGIPFRVTQVTDIPSPVTDPARAEAQALAQRPETREARLKLEQAALEVRIKEAAYIPDVDLKATYIKRGNTEFIPDESFFVGVVARWEIFDWGRRGDEVSRARRSVSEAHNSIREADHKVVADVNQRIRDLNNARNLVQVTAMAQRAAREKLRVTMNQYREQTALLDDVLKAESDLAQANSDHEEATLSVLTVTAELEKALGEE
jgi:outer membrane protein TolC